MVRNHTFFVGMVLLGYINFTVIYLYCVFLTKVKARKQTINREFYSQLSTVFDSLLSVQSV